VRLLESETLRAVAVLAGLCLVIVLAVGAFALIGMGLRCVFRTVIP
jgi:hypothetical protein